MFDYFLFWKGHNYYGGSPPYAWIDRLNPFIQGDRVLDIGCSGGDRFSNLFLERKYYLGVDINPIRIQDAKNMFPTLNFTCADINELNFPDDSFDVIFTCVALQHIIPEKFPALAEKMKRWAKRIVMVETLFEAGSAEYCFYHDYDKFFNIRFKDVVEVHPEGKTTLMIHD